MTSDVRIIQGDCRDVLATLDPDSVDCVVTSPPYWGLRDYGVDGQLGLERTLGEHLEVMVDVFAAVHRVLKPEGTVWLNYGDCYASTPNGRSAADTKALSDDDRTVRDKPFSTVGPIYATGQPFPDDAPRRGGGPGAAAGPVYEIQPPSRQATRKGRRGNLRNGSSDSSELPAGRIVAAGHLKPKDLCMVPNRLAIALQEAGWWVRSEIIWAKPNPMPESVTDRPATAHEKIWLLSKSARYWYDGEAVRQPSSGDEMAGPRKQRGNWKMPDGSFHRQGREKGRKSDKQRGHGRRHAGFNDRWDAMSREEQAAADRNLRNWEPPPMQVWQMATRPFRDAHFATFPAQLVERCLAAGCPPGGTVLDPFGGAGTVGLVAAAMMRKAILVELNEDYCRMAADRLRAGLVRVDGVAHAEPGPLFEAREAAE